jgi:hypothetical protein
MEVDAMPRQRASVSASEWLPDYCDPLDTCPGGDSRELFKHDIRQRAYEISLARRGAPGDARADWLQAETELSGRRFLGLM